MSTPDVQNAQPAPSPGLPDYLASPNAVLGDTDAQWRYGRAPDYSKTRGVWAKTKKANHVAGSLPELVENLVKNWEVEASFKTKLSDWRTVDHENYTFAINGGPPQTGEYMLKVGTYNAIIAPNEYYSPENSDFASSHKTFKRMMPTFAWEVIEVYSGPPRVSFKWRHWGVMKNDYVGFNDKGEKVTAKAHGGTIDILGITIATVDDKVRLQAVDTYFDPLDMFRQIAPNGIVNKQVVNRKVFDADKAAALDNIVVPDHNGIKIGQEHNGPDAEHKDDGIPHSSSDVFHDAVSEAPSQPAPNGGTTSSATAEPADSGSGTTVTQAKGASDTTGSKDTTKDVTAQVSSLDSPSSGDSAACPVAGGLAKMSIGQDACPVTGRSRGQSQSSGSAWEHVSNPGSEDGTDNSPYSSSVTGNIKERISKNKDYSAASELYDDVDRHLEGSAEVVHPHPKTMENSVKPSAGEAVAVEPDSEETFMTHEEMSRITPSECPFLMNRE